MSSPKIILISGWKNSGKDTAADYLNRKHDYARVAFADTLKELVAEQYNVPINWFHDRTLKETPLLQYPVKSLDGFSRHVNEYMHKEFRNVDGVLYHTPRSLAILEGSVKRSVDANYWVKRAVDGYKIDIVIPDWRYKSEYEALKDRNPITIRINRFDSTTSTDPSERDLDDFKFDFTIANKGSVADLETTLNFFFKADSVPKVA